MGHVLYNTAACQPVMAEARENGWVHTEYSLNIPPVYRNVTRMGRAIHPRNEEDMEQEKCLFCTTFSRCLKHRDFDLLLEPASPSPLFCSPVRPMVSVSKPWGVDGPFPAVFRSLPWGVDP